MIAHEHIKPVLILLAITTFTVLFLFFGNKLFFKNSPVASSTVAEPIGASSTVQSDSAVIINSNLPASGSVTTTVDSLNSNTTMDGDQTTKAQLQNLAIFFANYFGSFSNQSNFANLRDLFPSMSANYKKQTENFIIKSMDKTSNSEMYSGINTQALAVIFDHFNPSSGRAAAIVSTMRVKTGEGAENSLPYNQDLRLSFIKESGIWKINQAAWE